MMKRSSQSQRENEPSSDSKEQQKTFDILEEVVVPRSRGETDAETRKLELFEALKQEESANESEVKGPRKSHSKTNETQRTTQRHSSARKKEPVNEKDDSSSYRDDDFLIMKMVQERQQLSQRPQSPRGSDSPREINSQEEEEPTLETTSLRRSTQISSQPQALPGAFSAVPGMELRATSDDDLDEEVDEEEGPRLPVNYSLDPMMNQSSLHPENTSSPEANLVTADPVDDETGNLPQAQEFDVEKRGERQQDYQRHGALFVLFFVVLLGTGIAIVVAVSMTKEDGNKKNTDSFFESLSPTRSPTQDSIASLLPEYTHRALEDHGSPQSRAYRWLLNDTGLQHYTNTRIIQRFALATLFFALGGGNGHWQPNSTVNWLSYDVHECDWAYGSPRTAFEISWAVEEAAFTGYNRTHYFPLYPKPDSPCLLMDGELQYEVLWMDSAGLYGTIPLEMYLLTSLKVINMKFNNVGGTISEGIGGLARLEVLSLFGNSLTGTIPTEIAMCKNLSLWSITRNQVTGTIPTEIGSLRQLKMLFLENNLLHGTIPSELGLLTSVNNFGLYRNPLTGSLPTELGNLRSCMGMVIINTFLTGTIPSELGQLSSVTNLSLRSTDSVGLLTGSIPSELGNLSNLRLLLMQGNELQGSIPSELGRLKDVWSIDLSRNRLSGSLATELSGMHSMLRFLISGNQLTGTIPSEFALMQNLDWLRVFDELANPVFAGHVIKHERYEIQWNFSSNSLSGPIPSELGKLGYMYQMTFGNNSLTSTIPVELGMMSQMEVLELQDNALSGSVPSELAQLVNVSQLNLANNALAGFLPTELCKVAELSFDCSDSLCGCSCNCSS